MFQARPHYKSVTKKHKSGRSSKVTCLVEIYSLDIFSYCFNLWTIICRKHTEKKRNSNAEEGVLLALYSNEFFTTARQGKKGNELGK